ncbi:hypothetical protein [Pseudomonas nitroreducens]|uniref:hypothetical protein n=1 Tax=Pseudomonas nitroreducens TaxID=46680 RepID=UPI00265B3602|nr:hypothetical protein [Pseudomonas nitroreducens]MCP1652715.1 hypothetical protein [Pseudomonas nitroreducens]
MSAPTDRPAPLPMALLIAQALTLAGQVQQVVIEARRRQVPPLPDAEYLLPNRAPVDPDAPR